MISTPETMAKAWQKSSLLERRKRAPLVPFPEAKGGSYEHADADGVQGVQPMLFRIQSTEALSDCTTAESTNASPAVTPGMPCEGCCESTPPEKTNACPRHAWTATTSPSLPGKIRREENKTSLRVRRNRRHPSIDCELVKQAAESDPFIHSQCPTLTDRYDGFQKLGEGSCGVVYKVRSRKDNEEVAIKVIRMQDEELLSIARKEYEMLRQVSHPNIIKAIDFFTYSMGAVLVLDYFEGKNLTRAVREAPGRRLWESTVQHVSIQLLGAIAKLHSCGIIHRDVKADNILLSHDLSDLRLVDFNAAKLLADGPALTMTGTVEYMPPEVLYGESPSQASDVWAAGLCIYLMLDGRLPAERRALRPRFDCQAAALFGKAPSCQGALVCLEGEKWERLTEACKETVKDCLETCPSLRPTAADMLTRAWLSRGPREMRLLQAAALN